jgi:hypothetical protein
MEVVIMYIYSESELRGFTVKELREEAKSLKIKFWYNKTKAELVSDILEATAENAENNINNVEENGNMEEIREATISEDSTVEKVGAVQTAGNEDEIADNSYATLISHKKTPGEYIDNVEVGMIIAFATEPEKAISAKVKEIFRAEDNGVKEVLAVSKNGYTYKVPRAAIVWVKTGHRWPRGIYDKLRNSYIKREEATVEIKEESETF